ncbi:MAG: MmgE/PrpD family protein [Chloroflexi bacterium]|nr:MmgE/PrpD family protein [Chloroflexota bacterium]
MGTAGAGEISDVTRELAAWIAGARVRPLPAEVVEKAKHHTLDTLSAMVSGSRLRPGELGIAYVRRQGAPPEASIAGTALLASAELAAFANGMTAHADETDDSHAPSFTHPGCAVIPAALAMAEREGRSGTELLRSIVLGYELCARSTMSLGRDELYAAGHSTHAFGGLFGAAAAAGALAGLDETRSRWLLSYAAQQAAGITCWARDEEHIEKAFHFGAMPASRGVLAASLVAFGFSGVDDVLSGPRNFFEAFSEQPQPELLTRELGARHEILHANIKKWPVGSPIQAALDSAQRLRAEHRLTPERIARVRIRLPDIEAHVVDDRAMPDINAQHLVTVMLLDGDLGFAAAHDYERMRDPAVRRLREVTTLIHDPELGAARPRRQAIVEVDTTDGRSLAHRTRAVRGTADDPMTRAEVEAKSLDLLTPVLGAERTRELVAAVWDIEALADARELRALLAGRGDD